MRAADLDGLMPLSDRIRAETTLTLCGGGPLIEYPRTDHVRVESDGEVLGDP